MSKESQGAKSKDETCGCTEKEYVCYYKLEPKRYTDWRLQLLEKRAAKEAMDAKREKMSSYDIWMEAARGKRKKANSGKNYGVNGFDSPSGKGGDIFQPQSVIYLSRR